VIPRVLHRVVLPPLTPTGTVQEYWDRFARLHPDWEMRTWGDQLDPKDWELGHLFATCRTPAALADVIRLEILWRYGGIYVDTDCEPVRALDQLLRYDFFLGTEDGWYLANTVMGSVPGHPALRAYMDAILDEGRLSLDVPPNEATGPSLATEILGDREDVVVLPPEFFYPEPYIARFDSQRASAANVATPFTYVVHRWAHSWADERPSPPARRTLHAALRGQVGSVMRRTKARWDRLSVVQPAGTFGCYLGHDRALVRLPNGSPLLAVASDRSLTPELLANGIYDRPFWLFLEKVLRPGDHAVDVGANIGLFTVRMAQLVKRFGAVHAFEPDPELADVLADNLQANWLNRQVKLHRAAATALAGEVTFHRHATLRGLSGIGIGGLPPHQGGASGGFEEVSVPGRRLFEEFSVPGTRLDDVLPTGIPLRLVKIDVEGAESEVLNGMRGTLDAGGVRMIDLEVVRPNAAGNWMQLVDWMRRLVHRYGALVFVVAGDGSARPVVVDHIIATAGHFSHVLFVFDTKSLPDSSS